MKSSFRLGERSEVSNLKIERILSLMSTYWWLKFELKYVYEHSYFSERSSFDYVCHNFTAPSRFFKHFQMTKIVWKYIYFLLKHKQFGFVNSPCKCFCFTLKTNMAKYLFLWLSNLSTNFGTIWCSLYWCWLSDI